MKRMYVLLVLAAVVVLASIAVSGPIECWSYGDSYREASGSGVHYCDTTGDGFPDKVFAD